MAGTDSSVNLHVTTVADTDALVQVENELRKVGAAGTEAMQKGLQNKTATVEEIKRITDHVRNLRDKTEEVPPAAAAAGKGMKNMGWVANQVSMQVGDMTQTIAMGGGVMRGFSQQAPQVIGVLQQVGVLSGPVGLAAGAVAAALPIISMFVSSLSNSAKETKDELHGVSDATKTLRDEIVESTMKQVESIGDLAENAAKYRQDAYEEWGQTKQAIRDTQRAVRDAAIGSIQAEDKLLELQGQRVDKMREIVRLSELERQGRDAEEAKKNEEAQKQADKAAEEAEIAEEKLNAVKERQAAIERQHRAAEKEVQRLTAQKVALQEDIEAEKRAPSWLAAFIAGPSSDLRGLATNSEPSLMDKRGQIVDKAQTAREALPDLEDRLAHQRELLKRLDESSGKMSDQFGQGQRKAAEEAAINARKKAEDMAAAAQQVALQAEAKRKEDDRKAMAEWKTALSKEVGGTAKAVIDQVKEELRSARESEQSAAKAATGYERDQNAEDSAQERFRDRSQGLRDARTKVADANYDLQKKGRDANRVFRDPSSTDDERESARRAYELAQRSLGDAQSGAAEAQWKLQESSAELKQKNEDLKSSAKEAREEEQRVLASARKIATERKLLPEIEKIVADNMVTDVEKERLRQMARELSSSLTAKDAVLLALLKDLIAKVDGSKKAWEGISRDNRNRPQ